MKGSSITKQFRNWLESEITGGQLMTNLTAGLLLGTTEIVFAISLGSLVFSGNMVEFLPVGIGIALASTAILLIGTALISSIPGVIGSLQDNPAVILSLMIPALIDPDHSGTDLPTVLMTIALASLLTGLFLLALGQFKLGGLVRFIPYPVVGGFMAGLGWLLTQASFDVMTGFPLIMGNIPTLMQPVNVLKWLPGVIFALTMLFVTKKWSHQLTMPVLLISSILIYFLFLFISGITFQGAFDLGLIVGEIPMTLPWSELNLESLRLINWNAILSQSGNYVVILLLSAISLLFNISGLELATQDDIDLNHELRTAGSVNILSGLVGGMAGYQTLGDTILNFRLGVRGKLAGILAGIFCAIVLLAGTNLLAFFPISIMGGLLLYLGLEFLYEWLVLAWSQLSRADYFIVILILLVIATTDILIGIGVGLGAMIVLFVVNYSQIDVVQHDLTGAELQSNVQRSLHHQQVLKHSGDNVHILELRGYLFFGTANSILERIRMLLHNPESPAKKFIVMDFQRVSGLDSSAANSFLRCMQIAEAHQATLVMTAVPKAIQHQLGLSGFLEDNQYVSFHPDLDRGLEWCEDHIIADAGLTVNDGPISLKDWLTAGGMQKNHLNRFLSYLEQVEINEGEYLIHQEDQAEDMYFIERGQVSIYLEHKGKKQTRLRTMDTGTMVGEIGMFLAVRRTASVIADEPCIAYRLTKTSLTRMKKRDPDLAADFHELSVTLLARRLTDTNLLVGALRR